MAAKKLVWKDATSYSQGERGRVPADSWECRTKSLRVCVHRSVGYDPKLWLLSCHDIRLECYELSFPDLKKCQAEAIEVIQNILRDLLKELDGSPV